MAVIDLASLEWSLRGWQPFAWRLFWSAETGQALQAQVGPVPARVPGSVQQALLEAGILPDWHEGANSRACEWVEHRHWQFSATLPAGAVRRGERCFLDARGLDYAGWVFVDGQEAGAFEGTFLPHRFELTPFLAETDTHRLDIFFDEPPREQGQIGYTSRSRHFKPRYNYGWDWIPRVVSIGVWDALTLRTGLDAALSVKDLRAKLGEDLATGRVELLVCHDAVTGAAPADIYEAELRDGDRVVGRTSAPGQAGETRLALEGLRVEPWWPNGAGPEPDRRPKVYTLEVRAICGSDTAWRHEAVVGFKRLEWRPYEGAPADAEPWVCVVNGEPVFLQGVNWTPVRAVFPDTRPEEYVQLVEQYRDIGFNCIRVWGGGLLEREPLYDACDRAGLLTWQDFPLSSSGVENYPPTDDASLLKLKRIAETYVREHGYHVSRLLYCGGNELMERDGSGRPVGYDHPCIAMLRGVVERCDPGRRFIATTALGPAFYAHSENFGKGLHHNVHGPWGMGQHGSMEAWKEYWSRDDSLFRAEVGMPGAEPIELIRRYAGGLAVWPPTGDCWKHSCPWWIDWDRHRSACGEDAEALARYVERTRLEQAEALEVAARACKGRFPACGGIVFWHGHDCFPCPINNSLIDFERNPKPVCDTLRKVFRG